MHGYFIHNRVALIGQPYKAAHRVAFFCANCRTFKFFSYFYRSFQKTKNLI